MLRWRLLQAIADMPGHGPGHYAKALAVSAGAVARALDALEERGFIVRRQVPDRANHAAITVTNQGRKALAEGKA